MIVTLLTWAAFAQEAPPAPATNVQNWRVPVDAQSTLWTDDAGVAPDGYLSARAAFGYVREPLVWSWDTSGEQVSGVSDALQLDVVAAYTRGPMRIAVDAPVYLMSMGDAITGGAGFGDVALDVKMTALDGAKAPVGLAMSGRVALPTATVAAPLGYGGFGYEIVGIAHKQAGPVLLAVNIGTRGQPDADLGDLQIGDRLIARAGAGWAASDAGGFSLDVAAHPAYTAMSKPAGVPVEAVAGGWLRVSDDFVLRAGAGRGLTSGIGAPAARGLLVVAYEPPRARDTDGDLVLDNVDACPIEPEDLDGFDDADGCPEFDNDRDGLVDTIDRCPDVREDRDTWQDEDGCPDPRTLVRVQIVDVNSQPITATIRLGDSTTAGSEASLELDPGDYPFSIAAEGFQPIEARITVPEGAPYSVVRVLSKELARTGTVQVTALAPSGEPIPTATWTFGEGDGASMPEGVGVLTMAPGVYPVTVSAPNFLPTSFPVQIEAGQTEELSVVLYPMRVKVTREKLEISDKIYFETNKDVIRPDSYPLLDEIVEVLRTRPDILEVRIEGHTDSRGSDRYNQDLSQRRAAAVLQYLIDKGVEPGRLTSAGYGESAPLDPSETPDAWDRNRRVEFVIGRWDE